MKKGASSPGCDGGTIAVVEIHVRGAVDDEEFLGLRGSLGVKLLAMPQRACLAAGDHQERLRQEGFGPLEPSERCQGADAGHQHQVNWERCGE